MQQNRLMTITRAATIVLFVVHFASIAFWWVVRLSPEIVLDEQFSSAVTTYISLSTLVLVVIIAASARRHNWFQGRPRKSRLIVSTDRFVPSPAKKPLRVSLAQAA